MWTEWTFSPPRADYQQDNALTLHQTQISQENRTNHSLAMHHSGNEYQIHIQTRSTDYSFPNAERKSPSKKCRVSTIKGACQVEKRVSTDTRLFPVPLHSLAKKKWNKSCNPYITQFRSIYIQPHFLGHLHTPGRSHYLTLHHENCKFEVHMWRIT